MSISTQFVLLLTVTFALVAVFAIRLTLGFSEYSTEGNRLTQNFLDTFELNQELRAEIKSQATLLARQFERLDPEFSTKFTNINYDLGAKQIKYLKLNIGENERITVENIKKSQAELGVQAFQIHELLLAGRREDANARLDSIEELQNL